MSSVIELLAGILRLFPNMMMVTLFVVGIATGKLAWLAAASGGAIVAVAVLAGQVLSSKLSGDKTIPGFDVVEACSLIPTMRGEQYTYTPSFWVALTTFFASFIFTNALNVYSAQPGPSAKSEVIPVQQRKSIGLISMISVTILFLFLMIARWNTSCESLAGLITGIIIGAGTAVGWWYLLGICGMGVFPDIHGVMIGLGPAALRINKPVICIKK
jgi:hypothetical protein